MSTSTLLSVKQISRGLYLSRRLLSSNSTSSSISSSSNNGINSSNSSSNNAPLILTEKAINRLKEITKPNEHLRILVEGGGCSGFEYKLTLDDKLTDEDLMVEKDGAKVVVDKMSLEFIKGSTVDYAEEMMRSTFRLINNPLADKGCSCGSSFSIKM